MPDVQAALSQMAQRWLELAEWAERRAEFLSQSRLKPQNDNVE